jgi:hypothetical protein
MSDRVGKHVAQPVFEGCGDAENEVDRPGGAVIVPMGAAAISGFIVGLLCRGGFVLAGVALLLALFCGYTGWWVRGFAR